MQLRVARHTERLDELVAFYRDGIGLPEIGGFRDHDGYDGVFLDLPGTGAHLELLTVTAPRGANIGVRCRGGGCPYHHKRTTSKGKPVTLRKLARNYRAGAVIEIRVTKKNTIGKFTRIRIRAGRTPKRFDGCLNPGKPNKPFRC